MKFSHLHVHTQFSLLDGAAMIEKLFLKAKRDEMPAVAITDHGNMFGVFKFVKEANKHNIKPIIGCEFYLVKDRFKKQFTKEDRDIRNHQILLAKNKNGYHNLIKLCSLGYIDGYYSKYPRIDKELIKLYHKDLIATTCCLAGIIPQFIKKDKINEAEEELKWWLDIFQEDFYIELQRHNLKDDEKVNAKLVEFAYKYNVKIIATNDSHYVEQGDANFQDILACIMTGSVQSTPIFHDDNEVEKKGYRFGFAGPDGKLNDAYSFKSQVEMSNLFSDLPQAIDNTNEIIDKVDNFELTRDILLPNFKIESPFISQNEYLRHLTEQGAIKRYGNLEPDIQERINLELGIIENMDFAGYFLIVADFINAARDLGVAVGPGRGSAAGSIVSYCLGITDIDPIKYNLLFERFLNPDRKSMPDIDIDFDDAGREKVIEYVVQRYSKEQVAQIITYSTIAAKTSIRDCARVLDLPLKEANNLAKLVPDTPGTRLNKIFSLYKENKLEESYSPDELKDINKLIEYHNYIESDNDKEVIEKLQNQINTIHKEILKLEEKEADSKDIKQYIDKKNKLTQELNQKKIPITRSKVLKEALNIEGMIRNVGTHAAGIIIAPQDLKNIIPIMKMKDSEMYISQYEGSVIEEAGVIKMDFLGLKTLSIIKDAIENIKTTNQGLTIDINTIPLDDKKTYELYQKGETNGTFQFESVGMQKHLRNLKPDRFEDLVALNALYRPGPMDYIDNYIGRKHKTEKVSYDLPEMEEYLSDTYGITVYQEQVMLLAQKLSGLSRGDADLLRKAMGKKDKKTLDKLKDKFIEGATAKGYQLEVLQKIWSDWESFAEYAFNKSHSVCYALLAYRTAYLKAHYPAEYMAAVLTHTRGNLSKITFFIEECKRMGIKVLGPSVNGSLRSFSAYSSKEIHFGLEGIKSLGEVLITKIIEDRDNNECGKAKPFKDFEDFVKRVNPNKLALESLAYSGAFDGFEFEEVLTLSGGLENKYISGNRGIYVLQQYENNKKGSDAKKSYIEIVTEYMSKEKQKAKKKQEAKLFNDTGVGFPKPVYCQDLPEREKLAKEKEYLGIYISGHPLEAYKDIIDTFCNAKVADIDKVASKGTQLILAGTVSDLQNRITKTGKPYISFTIEDAESATQIVLFGPDCTKHKDKICNQGDIFVKGVFLPSHGRREEIEFKVTEIGHLEEICESMSVGININIAIEDLDGITINRLKKIFDDPQHAGNKQLSITLYDDTTRLYMDSEQYKVNLSQDLFKALSQTSISFAIKK